MQILDGPQWVEQQFGECQLGNSLRSRRLLKIGNAMLQCPEKSLPQQNPAWGDVKAAYRLFDQDAVTFNAVSDPHWARTKKSKPGRYLLISDTSDIDHFSHVATTGLGQLGKGDGRGMQLHSCLVYNCDDQQIEGLAGAKLNYRIKVPETETRMQRLNRRRESELWGDLVDQVGMPADGCRWIHVFDRGGDNFEAICRIQMQNCDWVIRAAKLNRNVLLESGEKMSLQSALEQSTNYLGSYELNLRSRRGVSARTAHIDVSVVKIVLPRPRHHSPWVKQCGIDALTANVVLVQETNAPKGCTPVRWVLLTSLPVKTFKDAWQVIEDYENRWLIEEYHKVLKTGCSIERHALRTAARLEPLIALISIIGIRLFQLKLIGRNQSETKAVKHVPAQWLECICRLKPNLRKQTLTAYQFFRELAKLGGFLARKHDGEPGWQTVWNGYQKLHWLLDGMRLANPP